MFIRVFKKAKQILTDCTHFLYSTTYVCHIRNVSGSEFVKQRGDA